MRLIAQYAALAMAMLCGTAFLSGFLHLLRTYNPVGSNCTIEFSALLTLQQAPASNVSVCPKVDGNFVDPSQAKDCWGGEELPSDGGSGAVISRNFFTVSSGNHTVQTFVFSPPRAYLENFKTVYQIDVP